MGDIKSITLLPKTGAIYEGGVPGDETVGGLGNYLASVDERSIQKPQFDVSLDNGKNITKEQLDQMSASLNSKKGYEITELSGELRQASEYSAARQEIKKKARGRDSYSANLQLSRLDQEYKGVVGGETINQLTIVQFVNEIVGKLEQPSFVTTAFKHIGLDTLRGKIPEMGWPPVNVQVQRISEPKIDFADFGQAEFRIFRNDVHVYTSREDRMEATIDPHTLTTQQGQIQIIRARELLSLKACSTLVQDGTYGTLPSFTADSGSNDVPHAANDAPRAFVNVYLSHFNKFFNYLKFFIFNPLDYRDYLSNWFSFAYSGIEAPQGFGVVPMRGMEQYGITAIISPYVPRGYVYSLANEGAYELDGPYIVDTEYDAKKFADYNIIHDFIGYVIMNPTRYGEKLTITGVTLGTEITTNEQIEKLLEPPVGVVQKNSTANSL